MADYFAAVTSVCAMTGYEIERVIADGEWATVVCTLHVRFHADGSTAAYDKIDILRVVDGRVVEFREFYDTARPVGRTRAPERNGLRPPYGLTSVRNTLLTMRQPCCVFSSTR